MTSVQQSILFARRTKRRFLSAVNRLFICVPCGERLANISIKKASSKFLWVPRIWISKRQELSLYCISKTMEKHYSAGRLIANREEELTSSNIFNTWWDLVRVEVSSDMIFMFLQIYQCIEIPFPVYKW